MADATEPAAAADAAASGAELVQEKNELEELHLCLRVCPHLLDLCLCNC